MNTLSWSYINSAIGPKALRDNSVHIYLFLRYKIKTNNVNYKRLYNIKRMHIPCLPVFTIASASDKLLFSADDIHSRVGGVSL